MAGVEAAWNPKSDGPGTRTGLYNYDETSWRDDSKEKYSIENVQNMQMSTTAALNGLAFRYAKSQEKQPNRTAEQHLARAFSLFNSEEDRYGEYGYGEAVISCSYQIDNDFDAAYQTIWNLLHPPKK